MTLLPRIAGVLVAIEMVCCAWHPPNSRGVVLAETLVVVLASVAFLFDTGRTALVCVILEALVVVLLRARDVISPPLTVTRVDLSGKVAIVTGGYSGVGKETARVLAEWNATVILACRDIERAAKMADHLHSKLSEQSSGKIIAWELDLEALHSVRAFADRFLASNMPLHILVNNAGIRYHELEVTGDGLELHYQVNHLSHFLLSLLLLPRMEESTPARMVHVSSSAHAFGEVEADVYGAARPNTDKTHFRRRMQTVEGVYGDTKLMQVLFSHKLDSALRSRSAQGKSDSGAGARRVTSNAVHPGFVATNFGHRDQRWLQSMLVLMRPLLARDSLQGAMTQIFAATSPELEGKGGLYLDNCKVVPAAPQALKDDLQQWLWKTSAELTKLPPKLDIVAH